MTVSSTTSKVVYNGDDQTTEFSTEFEYLAKADVTVTFTDANGTETTWTEGTQYTLSDAGTGEAGTLTVITTPTDYTPASDTKLTILRAPSATQDTDLSLGGNLSTTVLEQTYDRNIMVVQRALEELDRAPKYPVTESGAADLPASTTRANMFLAFDTNGNPIAAAGTSADLAPVSSFMNDMLNLGGADAVLDHLEATTIGKDVFAAANADAALDTVGGIKQGKHTIWIPAAAMRPTVTDGCAALTDVETTAGKPDLQVLDFDAGATEEAAQFQVAFPDSWDEGTVTFQAFWTTTATGTTGVAWGLQCVAVSDGDTADVNFGTAVVVTDDAQSAAEDVLVTVESAAVTIDGTPAAGDLCFFRVFRDTDDVNDVNDDMAEDARLIGVKLFYTIDARDDA